MEAFEPWAAKRNSAVHDVYDPRNGLIVEQDPGIEHVASTCKCYYSPSNIIAINYQICDNKQLIYVI